MTYFPPDVLTKTVAISSAEILALNTTAVTLLPAPATGYAYDITEATLLYYHNTSSYALPGNILIREGTRQIINFGTTMTSRTVNSIQKGAMQTASSSYGSGSLNLYAQTGNPTAGNGTFSVVLYYRLIPL